MTLIKAKQVERLLDGYVHVQARTKDNVVTTTLEHSTLNANLQVALNTAGEGGVPVPLRPSINRNTSGVIVTGNNIVQIWRSTNGEKISDLDGNEVYGRIVDVVNSQFVVNLYTRVAGVETAYSMNEPTYNVELAIPYKFTFDTYPSDSAISIPMRFVREEVSAGIGYTVQVVTGQLDSGRWKLNGLGFKINDTNFKPELYVNGIWYTLEEDLMTTPFSYTAATGVVVWRTANAGFSLGSEDKVVIKYVRGDSIMAEPDNSGAI